MPNTNYTVATTSQMVGDGWENQSLERLGVTEKGVPQQTGDRTRIAQKLDFENRSQAVSKQTDKTDKADNLKPDIFPAPVSILGHQAESSSSVPTVVPTSVPFNKIEAEVATGVITLCYALQDPQDRQDAEPEDAEPEDAEPQDAEPQDAEPEDAEPQDAEPQETDPQDIDPPGNADTTWRVRAQDVDRLIVALAHAGMMQNHVQGEMLDPAQYGIPDRRSFMSLRSQLQELKKRDSATSLPTITVSAPTPTPGRPLDLIRSPRAHFAGLGFMKAKTGAPKPGFWSPHFARNSQILQNGQSRARSLLFESTNTTIYRIRIQTVSLRSGQPNVTVFLQLESPVLVRTTGKKIYTMATEIDVTESFRKAALTELVEQAKHTLDDVVIVPAEGIVRQKSNESIDWCAAADEPQSEKCDTDKISVAIDMISNLERETCVMQTLTLMSELSRIKRKYQDFVVVRCHDHHENGVPLRMSVPWISHHLYANSGKGHEISAQDMSVFRLHMIDITAKRSAQPQPFTKKVLLADKQRSVHFVPFLDGASEKSAGWVCFVRDVSDAGL